MGRRSAAGPRWHHRWSPAAVLALAFCLTAPSSLLGGGIEESVLRIPRTFAIAAPGAPGDLAPVDELAAALGRMPHSVVWYSAWATGADFPAEGAAAVASRGAVPEVTWEPWDPGLGVDQPSYALDRISAGDHDAYITRWAEQAARYGDPLIVRFAHEMNGDWYPWAQQVNGNGEGDYVAAWRHVRTVVREAGAANVRWRWAPNVPHPGSTPLRALYPGDALVDEVGLDGYNWSSLQPGTSWQSFAEIFEPGLSELATLSDRPVYVAEVGCPELGGDKAAWITDMWNVLGQHPEVRGLTWFNYQKETDWRIQSSPEAFEAFRLGLLAFR